MSRSSSFVVVVFWLSLLRVANCQAGPEIFSVTPDDAVAGEKLVVTGQHLNETRGVFFSVDRTVRKAKFRIQSESQLEVTFPEFDSPNHTAVIAVLGRTGMTVGLPASTLRIEQSSDRGSAGTSFEVAAGGVLRSARGVAVIEDGGIAMSTRDCGFSFVKKGGKLSDSAGPVVFYEKGATFGTNLQQRSGDSTGIVVPRITISPGIEPIRIRNVSPPDDAKSQRPSHTRPNVDQPQTTPRSGKRGDGRSAS